MQHVYLSRRNLITLLSKLDRKKVDSDIETYINKHDTKHPVYPQTDPFIKVTALEDEEYYTDRDPGIFSDSTENGILEAVEKYNNSKGK